MLSKDLLSGISDQEIGSFLAGEHAYPHALLGPHPRDGGVIIRAYHPEAAQVDLILAGEVLPMEKVHPGGLFAALVEEEVPSPYRLRFHFADGTSWERDDPYRFPPTLGEVDLHLFGEGNHFELYRRLGAHPMELEGVKGVAFAVWAPTARRVSVVGDFNRWDGRIYPLRALGESGVWEIFIPEISPGAIYKYEIKTRKGLLRIKTDPFAFCHEVRPRTGSIIWDLGRYRWGDNEWMERRKERNIYREPLNIYEVHLGSWKRVPEEGGRWLTYQEIAPLLVEHLKRYGFTHVELLPIMEHPLDESWGYETTGYYAPTSRYGTPEDFKYFVDYCHQNGIGVILDWPPAHFPKDDYSLRLFDGTPLYEPDDPLVAEHPDWGTLIFNYGRPEVRNFLLSSALFWLGEYHIDGLRVDAVASMLYLDYSRGPGQWRPNKYGGNENLEAIEFLKQLNEVIYARFPGCFTIAEESTAWPGVSRPVYLGGLGFGFKWDLGWMHDTLSYFSKDPVHRKWHQDDLTFSMLYAWSENFILPLSHDEVVHGKGSLYSKMPGDRWQKMANLRTLLAYMYTHPGKKLLFMGSEIAQEREWNSKESLDWHLLKEPDRRAFSRFLEDLGRLYLKEPPLWQEDHDPHGFEWVDCRDSDNSVFSYIRRAGKDFLICVLNLTPVPRFNYRIGAPEGGIYREILNSDSHHYGGSDLGNLGYVAADPLPWHGFPYSLNLTLPPLSCLILKRAGL